MSDSIQTTFQTLSIDERSRLSELERQITEGLQTFIVVGKALTEVRDSKLYREKYSTFETYCRERWNFKRSRAYQLIDAAKVSTIADAPLKNEAQARELAGLSKGQVRDVAARVDLSTATAHEVRQAASEVTTGRSPEELAAVERVWKICGINPRSRLAREVRRLKEADPEGFDQRHKQEMERREREPVPPALHDAWSVASERERCRFLEFVLRCTTAGNPYIFRPLKRRHCLSAENDEERLKLIERHQPSLLREIRSGKLTIHKAIKELADTCYD